MSRYITVENICSFCCLKYWHGTLMFWILLCLKVDPLCLAAVDSAGDWTGPGPGSVGPGTVSSQEANLGETRANPWEN